MNLGIVIAVSDYGGAGNDLPGCKLDGEAISFVFKSDTKFDDILVVADGTNSGNVKQRLVEFITRHKSAEIEDVVFYFTGHGTFVDDEFYYLLSDYDHKRLRQTSLENTELDNLLRTLKPKNAVKIVDACHSGAPYIKDPDVFDKYLDKTKGKYSNCYFLFSSQMEQRSYQDDRMSDFTRSVAESIRNHASDIIRYKDVIDYVSDAFSDSDKQRPFFVVQADFTETFCTISQGLRDSLAKLLHDGDLGTKDAVEGDARILQLLQKEAAEYCSKEEALERLDSFRKALETTPLSRSVAELYDITCESYDDYSEVPKATAIGKWLMTDKKGLFGSPKFEMKHNFKTGERVPLLSGFYSTVELPFACLRLVASPKLPNLRVASANVVPLISKTILQLFLSLNFYEEYGWEQRVPASDVKWTTFSGRLKDSDELRKLADRILQEYSDFLFSPIREKFSSSRDAKSGTPETDQSSEG